LNMMLNNIPINDFRQYLISQSENIENLDND